MLLCLACADVAVARWPALAAGDPLPRARLGDGAFGWLSEVRLGAALHGAGASKERSADLNGEVLFVSPFPRAWADPLPERWAWVAAPCVHLGAAPNLGGYTSKVYAGLTWTTALARDVVRPGDALRFDVFFGGSLNDGKLQTTDPKRRALGSRGLFRVGAEIGWQATPAWSVSVFYDHDSNGDLAPPNGSLNSVGLRLGAAF